MPVSATKYLEFLAMHLNLAYWLRVPRVRLGRRVDLLLFAAAKPNAQGNRAAQNAQDANGDDNDGIPVWRQRATGVNGGGGGAGALSGDVCWSGKAHYLHIAQPHVFPLTIHRNRSSDL